MKIKELLCEYGWGSAPEIEVVDGLKPGIESWLTSARQNDVRPLLEDLDEQDPDEDTDDGQALIRDHRALTAVEYVIKNNLKVLQNPEVAKNSVFRYHWSSDDQSFSAIHINIADEVAQVVWLGAYMGKGGALMKEALNIAKTMGAKSVKVQAKWSSEGFYTKMGMQQQGQTTNNPLVGSKESHFTQDL